MTTVMGLTSVHARMDSLETCAKNVSVSIRPFLSTILNKHIMNKNKQANKKLTRLNVIAFVDFFLFHPSGRYHY